MTESTRHRIENAALDSFADLGYHATTMRMLARTAEVQPATLYHWYPSKEALLLSIMRGFLEGLTREVVDAVEHHSSTVDRLAAAVRVHVIYHGLHRRAAFVTDTEVRALTGDGRARILSIRDSYEQLFLQLVRDGIDADALTCRAPKIATRAILLQCTGVAMWFRPSGPLSLADVADVHVELVLNSLLATARPSSPSGIAQPDQTPAT